MYRIFFIFLFLINSIQGVVFSQNLNKLKLLNKEFADLSDSNTSYKLNYLKDKKTFIFEVSKKNTSLEYKTLIKDIHPEGVFFEEEKDFYKLKILSIDNGHRFIANKFRNKVRFSNTINLIIINDISLKRKNELVKFVKNLRDHISVEAKVELDSAYPQVILPKSKN
jgi:hypothetical protein|tara:strand:+ start:336 stop:836 length:501 start_codon:yes stop_codon:yes gene_type:complete